MSAMMGNEKYEIEREVETVTTAIFKGSPLVAPDVNLGGHDAAWYVRRG